MCLGHYAGLPVFVQGGLPNEQVQVEITKITSKYRLGFVKNLLGNSSKKRIESDCSHFGECGGCQFRQIEYSHELELKESALQRAFPGNLVEVLYGSAKEYRNSVKWNSDGYRLGFFKSNSNDLIPIDKCQNLPQSLQPKELLKNSKLIKTKLNQKEWKFRWNGMEIFPYQKVSQNMTIGDKIFYLPKNSFWQSNRFLLELWLEKVGESLNDCKSLSEFFCGVGTIGLGVPQGFDKYLGIEGDGNMIEAAKKNAYNMNKNHYEFEQMDLYSKSLGLDWKKKLLCDGMVLNPPRNGLSSWIIETVGFARPKILVYSSCHLATLKRDWEKIKKFGYTITKLILFDFFPRTAHFEILLVAVR